MSSEVDWQRHSRGSGVTAGVDLGGGRPWLVPAPYRPAHGIPECEPGHDPSGAREGR